MSLSSIGGGTGRLNPLSLPSATAPLATPSESPLKALEVAQQSNLLSTPGRPSGLSLPDEEGAQLQQNGDNVAGVFSARGRRG